MNLSKNTPPADSGKGKEAKETAPKETAVDKKGHSEVFGTTPSGKAGNATKGAESAAGTDSAPKGGASTKGKDATPSGTDAAPKGNHNVPNKFSDASARPQNDKTGINLGKIKEAIDKKGKDSVAATPEKQSPQERAKDGTREYTDPKSHRHYEYDEKGRIKTIKSKTGCTTRVNYADDSATAKPSQVSLINDKNGQMLASITASSDIHIRIDQKTGDIVSSHLEKISTAAGATPAQQVELQVRHTISPDGLQSKVRSTMDGHRIEKELINKDLQVYGKIAYMYSDKGDKSGKDGAKEGPVSAVQIDAQGRPVHKYVFENPEHVEKQKPQLREDITYRERDGKHIAHHERFDLKDNGKSTLAGTTDVTVDLQRGTTTIVDKQMQNGKTAVEQTVSFDKDGKATTFRYKDALTHRDLTFSFDKLGYPAAVLGDTTGMGDKKALLEFAALSVEGFIRKYDVQKLEDSTRATHMGPTAPRDGEHPSGTIVWQDGQSGYRQGRVEKGVIFDATDKAIGTVKDNGDVTITAGGAQRTFNIISDGKPGEAFHGIGTNEQRLELCAGQNKDGSHKQEGYNGILTRLPGDGVNVTGANGERTAAGEPETISVIGGNMYNAEGKFIGHMDKNGKITFDALGEPKQDAGTELNSLKKGDWVFVGNDNGKQRQFDVNNSMSNGRLFLPQIDTATGQPQFVKDGKPVAPTEYEVVMGMLLNKQTGEQIGKFIPPTDVGDRLDGGFIVTGNPPQKIPLANFTRAVFEVDVMGDNSSRTIKGLSLGASMDADGSYRPDEGGLVNLSHALRAAHNRVDDAKVKSQNTEADLLTVSLAQREEARQKSVVDGMLADGVVTDDMLFRLHKQTSNAESALLGDGLVRMRAKLEHQQDRLEKLPPVVSGSAKLPDATAPGGIAECDIAENVLYRKGTKTAIGAINPTDGTMQLFDGKGNLTASHMNQLAGAVWHLEYKGEKGQSTSVDWITNDRGQIKSVADMKRQVADELAYARAFDKEAQDEASRLKIERTEQLAARFNKAIDNAVLHGIPNPLGDGKSATRGSALDYLDGSVHKFVNAEKQEAKSPPKIISVRNMSPQDWSTSHGAMRLGEDHYSIDRGQIYRMKIQNGQLVRGEQCGNMENGYVAHIDGQRIQLSQQSQLLLKFTTDGDTREHRIIGLGKPRTDSNGAIMPGGLVEADELLRRGMEAQQMAKESNFEYLQNLPYVTDRLSNLLSYDKEGQMAEIRKTMDAQMEALNKEMNQLFVEGMSGKPITNNHLDHNVHAVHVFLKDMNLSTQDHYTLAREATDTQKQTADVAAMTMIGLLTAGSGTMVSMAGLTGRAAFTTQMGVNVLGGGFISAAVRTTRGGGAEQFGDNFASGMIEAGVMSFGAQGAKFVSQLKVLNAAKLGRTAQLTLEEQKLLLSLETKALAEARFVQKTVDLMGRNKVFAQAVEGLWRPGNALVQSTAFTAAGAIRERNFDMLMNPQHLAEGTMWMLGGEYVGMGLRRLGNVGKLTALELKEAQKTGQRVLKQWHGGSPITKFLDEWGQMVPEEMANNFANSGLGAMTQGLEMERDRLARMHHVDRSAISNNFLKLHADMGNVLDYMLRSAAEGAVTSPLSSFSSHLVRNGADYYLNKDIPKEEARLKQLMAEAHEDPLTKAGSRLGFDTSVQAAIEDAMRNNGKFCVTYIDLNNFKLVNDTLGYDTGDKALKVFKETAEKMIRQQDYLARFGGDEFGILLRDTDQVQAVLRKLQDIAILCEPGTAPRVLTDAEAQEVRARHAKLKAEGKEPADILVTPGLGGVTWKPGQTVSDLTRAADAAMGKNKKAFKAGEKDYEFIHATEDLPPLREEKAADKETALRLTADRFLSDTSNEFHAKNLSFEDLGIYRRKLKEACRQYTEIVSIHPHTRLPNKNKTEAFLESEVKRCERDAQTISMVIADLDNFKLVNDRFGHEKGDEVLRMYGKFLSSLVRKSDFAGSFGGDEGVLVARNAEDTQRLIDGCHSFGVVVTKDGMHQITTKEEMAQYVEMLKKERAEGNETFVLVGISAGAADWQPGLTAKQLQKHAETEMKKVKAQHEAEGRRIKRSAAEGASEKSESERTTSADESGTGKRHRIDPHELTQENIEKILFDKLLLYGVERDEKGKEILTRHNFLTKEVMNKFIDGIGAVTGKWEKIDPTTYRGDLDAEIGRRLSELQTAVDNISLGMGMAPVPLVRADQFLYAAKARAAHSLGKGSIKIRTSDLLGIEPDTESGVSFTAAIFHEMMHFEQDTAMARASAVDLLRKMMADKGLTAEQAIDALKNPTVFREALTFYEENCASSADQDWFRFTVRSENGLKWIAKRLQADFDLSADREYQRALVLQKSFREEKETQKVCADLLTHIKALQKMTADPDTIDVPGPTAMSFLVELRDSAEARIKYYGYDPLDSRFDERDSTFVKLLEDIKFAKKVMGQGNWQQDLQNYIDQLKAEGKPYQEFPRHPKLLARLELKALLRCGEEVGWRQPFDPLVDEFGYALNVNMKKVIDYMDTTRYNMYAKSNFELEAHYVTSAFSKHLRESEKISVPDAVADDWQSNLTKAMADAFAARGEEDPEPVVMKLGGTVQEHLELEGETDADTSNEVHTRNDRDTSDGADDTSNGDDASGKRIKVQRQQQNENDRQRRNSSNPNSTGINIFRKDII